MRQAAKLSLKISCGLLIIALNAGCARAPLDLPAQELKALDYEATAVEAYRAQDFQRSYAKFSEALRLNASIDNRGAMVFDLINLGRVSIELGRPEQAMEYLKRAETLAFALKDDRMASEAVAGQAKALVWMNDPASAAERLQRSIDMDSAIGVNSGAKMNLMAAIRVQGGEYDKARLVYEDALKANRSASDNIESANSLRGLSALYERAGEPSAALKSRLEAYDLDRKSGDAIKIMDDLGAMARLSEAFGDKIKAAFYYTRLYDTANANLDKKREEVSLTELVRLLTDAGKTEEAQMYSQKLDNLRSRGTLR